MVERVDHLLRTELHEPLGLASPNVQVLDPCCGTGAYLVEVLHRIERTLREHAGDDDALVGADLRRAATTRIFGFEIMPAPFVISHLQIAQLLEDARASLASTQRAQVFLTNALTGWVPARHPQSTFGFPAFTAERDAAEAVKQADTILVIIGNPPYNGYAGIAKIEEERNLTESYRTPISGLSAPQGRGLNDLYVRFFRIAERRIIGDGQARGNTNGRGLVSLISNNAWLDGLSHVTMRHIFLQEFQSIFVDNLNGDKYRTGKTTPEGNPDPSAFTTAQNKEGIQVGTAISTLVRSSGSLTRQTIHLRSLWGTEKLGQLDREAREQVNPAYSVITPLSSVGLSFADRTHAADYGAWPKLPEIFPVSFAGSQTARDSALIDIDVTRLEKRMESYLNPSVSDEAIRANIPALMIAKKRFQPVSVRRTLLNVGFRPWQIMKFAYRPFDVRWLYWEPNTKLLDEKREDFMRCVPFPCPILISQQKTRMDASFPQVISVLPDLALMDRGATSFPLFVMSRAQTLLESDNHLPRSSADMIGAASHENFAGLD
jgi:predicted helicase